ncbi:hypothetical protein MG293_010009 [Ovis ammon polii]|uniref:tRNA-binding domain-containing protein n=1 Tax=Ovis ammon polii TaxID=230172 RepID=A0AAD4U8D6_OVIAM|nr:hypothetical protein MG293_010009 [Ovis ammon polii]
MKMHFCIPVSQQRPDALGGRYVLYSVYLDGFLFCKVRYSQLHRWNEQLKRVFGNCLPPFPPKYYLAMTTSMADERRDQLEQYLQNVTMDPNMLRSDVFVDFLKLVQLEKAILQATLREEKKLRLENAKLKKEIKGLKQELIKAEIQNGVKQIRFPSEQVKGGGEEEKKMKEKAEKKGEKKDEKQQPVAGSADSKPVDVSHLDLRIGCIITARKHPDADSLYVEEVDVGETAPRTVVSGLVNHVPLEQMQNRMVVLLCNLKPAKMRGVVSQAMVMCASSPEKVEILAPPDGSVPGDRITFDAFPGEPDKELNPKKKIWEQIQPDLYTNDVCVATYKGAPFEDTFSIATKKVSLDIFLPDGRSIKVEILTSDTAERVLEVVSHNVGLCQELLGYFGLFLIQFCKEGRLSVVKKLADFELPYVSLRSSEVENCKVGLRKWYLDPSLDARLMDCRTAVDLIYMQFLELAREVRHYGYVQLEPCTCDHPEPGCQALLSVGNDEISCCITLPDNQTLDVTFQMDRVKCWQVTFLGTLLDTDGPQQTLNQNLELRFQYCEDSHWRWFVIYTKQAFLLSSCLKKMISEKTVKQAAENPEMKDYSSFPPRKSKIKIAEVDCGFGNVKEDL